MVWMMTLAYMITHTYSVEAKLKRSRHRKKIQNHARVHIGNQKKNLKTKIRDRHRNNMQYTTTQRVLSLILRNDILCYGIPLTISKINVPTHTHIVYYKMLLKFLYYFNRLMKKKSTFVLHIY